MSPAIPVRGDHAAGHGQAVRAGGVVELGPGHAALRRAPCALGIDRDPLHLGEVDHHPAVGDGAAGDVVAAAADRHLEPRGARERKRAATTSGASGSGRSAPAAVDEAVVDGARLVVARVLRGEDGAESGRWSSWREWLSRVVLMWSLSGGSTIVRTD